MYQYAIGDLHGCLEPLNRLLDRIQYRPGTDKLYFAGDIINRGPDSAGTLRRVRDLCELDGAQMVLGNHDLHFLGRAFDVRAAGRKDTLRELLDSEPRRTDAVRFLRKQPLIIDIDAAVIVHAGILPAWSIEEAVHRANTIEQRASLDDHFLMNLVDAALPTPDSEPEDASPTMQARFELGVLTRMRVCRSADSVDWKFNRTLDELGDDLHPWFDVPDAPVTESKDIVFGHWAALGFHRRNHVTCIDTGCVWGNQLTALRLDDMETFSVSAGDG